jgi:hypothetical protein
VHSMQCTCCNKYPWLQTDSIYQSEDDLVPLPAMQNTPPTYAVTIRVIGRSCEMAKDPSASASASSTDSSGVVAKLRDALVRALHQLEAKNGLTGRSLVEPMLADAMLLRTPPDDLEFFTFRVLDVCVPAREVLATLREEEEKGAQNLTELILLINQHGKLLSKYPPSAMRVFTYDSCARGLPAEDKRDSIVAVQTHVPAVDERGCDGRVMVDVEQLCREFAETVLGVECQVRAIAAADSAWCGVQ